MIKYLLNNIILVIAVIFLTVLGIFCILIDGDDVYKIFSIISLIYLCCIGIWMIYSSFYYKDNLKNNSNFLNQPLGYLIQGIVLIALGVIIVLFPNFIVRFVVGIMLIIQPLFSLIIADNKLSYLKVNFWKFIVGLIFILAIDIILDILLLIIGILLILIACFIIYIIIINYKDRTYPNIITKYIVIYLNKKNK